MPIKQNGQHGFAEGNESFLTFSFIYIFSVIITPAIMVEDIVEILQSIKMCLIFTVTRK